MSGYSAYGTKLGISTEQSGIDLTTTPTSWTYIGALTGIGGPNISLDPIDVTGHDSPDAYKEFVAGIIGGGDISLEGNLLTAGAGDEIMDLAEARENVVFRVKFPTAAASTGWDWLFAGAVTNFETDAPHDGKVGFTAGVKLTGKPFMTSTYATST